MEDADIAHGVEIEGVGRDDDNGQCDLLLVQILQDGEATHAGKNEVKNQDCKLSRPTYLILVAN